VPIKHLYWLALLKYSLKMISVYGIPKMIFLSEDGIMFLIYAIPGLFNPSLNIILTHFWDEIILWEAVEIIVEITGGLLKNSSNSLYEFFEF